MGHEDRGVLSNSFSFDEETTMEEAAKGLKVITCFPKYQVSSFNMYTNNTSRFRRGE